MLYNYGWEKQQTQRPKGSGPKKGQAGKETHQKKSCHGSKGPFQKHMDGQKIYIRKMKHTNSKQE